MVLSLQLPIFTTGLPIQSSPNKLGEIVSFAQFGNNLAGVSLDIITAERMLKKEFTWGRAVNPVPEIDFILGAAGQVASDWKKPNLTLFQRGGRALVVGGESIITGYLSDVAGGGGFCLGGRIAGGPGAVGGYVIASLGTSLYFDEVMWDDFNRRNFEKYELGFYP